MSNIALSRIIEDKDIEAQGEEMHIDYQKAMTILKQSEQAQTEVENTQLIKQASHLLDPLAVAGDADAQYALALCLRSSAIFAKDHHQALYWLEQAAAQQHKDALFELAMMLPAEHEHHLPHLNAAAEYGHVQAMLCMAKHEQRLGNMDGALYWLEQACQQNIGRAHYLLAQLYREGCGVEENPEQIVRLLIQAAEQGDVDAYFELFHAYHDGYGVKKDPKTALKYLNLARDHQHLEAASIEYSIS